MLRAAGKSRATKSAARVGPPLTDAPLPEAPEGFATPAGAATPAPVYLAGVDHLAALQANDDEVFAWWEATAAGVARARATFDTAARTRMVLRLHVVADRAGDMERRDLPVRAWVGQARLPVHAPGARVVLALGLTDGVAFAHLAHSRSVCLAPAPEPRPLLESPSIFVGFHRAWVGRSRPTARAPHRPAAAEMLEPTLAALERVARDGVPFRLTLALSPLFAGGLPKTAVERIEALSKAGHVEVATTPATFAGGNRLQNNALAFHAQLAVAVAEHERIFGRAPGAAWVRGGPVDAATLGGAKLERALIFEAAPLELEANGVYRAHARLGYDGDAARARAALDAKAWLTATEGRGTLALDAGHLGGRWHEGPSFLEAVLREAARRGLPTQPAARLPARLAPLDPVTDWTHRPLHRAAEEMQRLASAHPEATGTERVALDQAARELLLAQSGDWPRWMEARRGVETAIRQLRDHLEAFFRIQAALSQGRLPELAEWLKARQEAVPVLTAVDYHVFRPAPARAAGPRRPPQPPSGPRASRFGPEIY